MGNLTLQEINRIDQTIEKYKNWMLILRMQGATHTAIQELADELCEQIRDIVNGHVQSDVEAIFTDLP